MTRRVLLAAGGLVLLGECAGAGTFLIIYFTII